MYYMTTNNTYIKNHHKLKRLLRILDHEIAIYTPQWRLQYENLKMRIVKWG